MGAFGGRRLIAGGGILGLGFLVLAVGLPTAAEARFASKNLEISRDCETPERTLFRTVGPCKGQRITKVGLGERPRPVAHLPSEWSCQALATDACQLTQAATSAFPYAAHSVVQAAVDFALQRPAGGFEPAPNVALAESLPVAHPPDG